MAVLTINQAQTLITYTKPEETYTFPKTSVGYFSPEMEIFIRVSTIGGNILLDFSDEEERDEAIQILTGLF